MTTSSEAPSGCRLDAARGWAVAVLVLGGMLSWTPGADAAIPAQARRFLDAHCVDCHSGAEPEAGLALDATTKTPAVATWVRIHDRIQSGEMPPPEAEQPTAAEKRELLDWLAGSLTKVEQKRHAEEGRVILRRMNRREYENTLHDLLGIAAPLAALLPEDQVVHGFDTVSRALETSPTLLVRYQVAADRALDAALPPFPAEQRVTRMTGREWAERRASPQLKQLMQICRFDGDAVIVHARSWEGPPAIIWRDTLDGLPRERYRVRMRLRPVGVEDCSVMLARKAGYHDEERGRHILAYWDMGREGREIVYEGVPTDEIWYLKLEFLPWFGDLKKSLGLADKDHETPLPTGFAGPGLALEWLEIEGPIGGGVGAERLLGDLERAPQLPEGEKLPDTWRQWPVKNFLTKPLSARSSSPKDDADRLIRRFLPLAFRRPVPDDQAARYVAIVHDGLDAGLGFEEAIRAGYRAILCSPHFLSFIEEPGRLDDHAIAARLARFLWSSMPDDALFAAAAAGELSTPEGRRAQAERMLADPKAARFVKDFTDQWLELGRYLDMRPDQLYVENHPVLEWSAPLETRHFFARTLADDLPVTSFVDSDWTMLNATLANHYGVEGVSGMEFRPVTLRPEHRRGGVITHASILKLTTNASYTSPIKRGAWVLERIVGQPPPPPPPNINAVEPDIRGATTIREQLALHQNVASCAGCHRHIDPPGFALENYDVVGGWRERYRVPQGEEVELANYPGKKIRVGKPVEAGGEMADGRPFADIAGYKKLLLDDQDQLARSLAEKLLVYATGAPADFADREDVEKILAATRPGGHGVRALVHEVIQSEAFLSK
jgi:mono/diheme cytochrome c family protein